MYSSIFKQKMLKDTPMPFTLPEWIALAPFEEYLGMCIEQVGEGTAVLSMPFMVFHCQGAGLMHGGAVVALADTALAIAIKTVLPEGAHFATIDLSLKFLAPVKWGRLMAHAEIKEREGRNIKGEVQVFSEEGIKVAIFQAQFRVKRNNSEESKTIIL
jgi:uncharacterized protein (TIGR00369 family)